jgi:hypothetical protein
VVQRSATGWMIGGSIPGRGREFFSSPPPPERLWIPSSLLSNGYRGLFPCGQSGRGVKLTTHLRLVPRSRMRGAIHLLPHTPSWRGAQIKKEEHMNNFSFTVHQLAWHVMRLYPSLRVITREHRGFYYQRMVRREVSKRYNYI